MINLSHLWNHQNTQNAQFEKGENTKCDHFLPLRNRGVDFGLKTGSRGTPWNRKSAQPGGSDFAKCRFWSFKWHFGVFEGGTIFWHFLTLFHFSILSLFSLFHFSLLSLFCIFWFCRFWHFFWFCHFCHFSCFFTNLIYFLILKRVS